ncbi:MULTISPECIES: Uma2 family endonuclease [Spirulina sp. CCY15215]|uniref:Uma2 family endonuclease n=1 Tax=Spirulina sp. CCY15215 TaxID=2767591 RepID=UPI001951097A|nr:Uma2 family endonuclease [Spirulina major]
MTATIVTSTPTLEQFLKLPETKPASEYIEGEIVQKPMPKGKHSLLQLKMCNCINDCINERVELPQIAYALPELRCSFGNRSVVPDVAVFRWSRIPFDADGEMPNDFLLFPDWTIEILSPEQSSSRVIDNISYCLEYGCDLGWLLDPSDRSILVFQSQQQPKVFVGSDRLPILEEIDLVLTVEQVFSWLKMGKK